jgi:EAL domain-containing protein (putative c-di-GMP-specific phosphodiesterase class I)
MYAAKTTGRAALRFFEPAMAQRAYDDLLLEARLVQALRDQEFEVHFQPLREMPDGPVRAVEALLRWRDPARGLVLPDAFLPVAEARRLMLPLGRRVLQLALEAAAGWRRPGGPPVPVTVNVSAVEFQDPGFVDGVQQALAAAGLPGACLELELTERLLMEDLGSARRTLERLRACGIRIAVDDFGTGYTSLAHLRELPIDRLKIDRSFVRDLPHDPGAGAIVLTILQLARALGVAVVAEGVETEAQRDWLLAQGCSTMQGLLIAAPRPVGEVRV